MSSINDVQAALSNLVSDTTTALADIAAKVTALQGQVPDPAAVDQIVSDLNALDAQVKSADPGPQA